MNLPELRALLEAYRTVAVSLWPTLHPRIDAHRPSWATAPIELLERELDSYLRETEVPGAKARVFWKLEPDLRYAGCNAHFARDAGLSDPSKVVSLTDYDRPLPWVGQAGKLRADDRQVISSSQLRLDIVEAINSANGMLWLHTAKAPIRLEGGRVIGVMGAYEPIDANAAREMKARLAKLG